MAMLLLMTFPLVAPAFGQTAQQHLLLCCRKGGAHHCAASATMENGLPAPMFRQHCPACPTPSAAAQAATSMIHANAQSIGMEIASQFRIRQVEAGYRISFYRSRQKRGPPAIVLS